MASDKFDNLKCGNCGFDGGVQHLKERQGLKDQLHAREKELSDTESVRVHRIWGIAIATILSVVVLTFGGFHIANRVTLNQRPVPNKIENTTKKIIEAEHPISVAYKELSAAYKNCIDKADHSSEFLNGCNTTFVTAQVHLEKMLKEEKSK